MLIPGGDAFIENLVEYLKQHDIQLLQGDHAPCSPLRHAATQNGI
jgi:hypothetical protein